MKTASEDCPLVPKGVIIPELQVPKVHIGDILESAEEIIDRFSGQTREVYEALSRNTNIGCYNVYSHFSEEDSERVTAILLDKGQSENRDEFCKNSIKIFQKKIRESVSGNMVDVIPNMHFTLMEFLKNTYDHGSGRAFIYLFESDKEIVLICKEMGGNGILNEMRSQGICGDMGDLETWQWVFTPGFSSKIGNGENMGVGMSNIFRGMIHNGFHCSFIDSGYTVRVASKNKITEELLLNIIPIQEQKEAGPTFIAKKSLKREDKE